MYLNPLRYKKVENQNPQSKRRENNNEEEEANNKMGQEDSQTFVLLPRINSAPSSNNEGDGDTRPIRSQSSNLTKRSSQKRLEEKRNKKRKKRRKFHMLNHIKGNRHLGEISFCIYIYLLFDSE